jgi:hypothetical protein
LTPPPPVRNRLYLSEIVFVLGCIHTSLLGLNVNGTNVFLIAINETIV